MCKISNAASKKKITKIFHPTNEAERKQCFFKKTHKIPKIPKILGSHFLVQIRSEKCIFPPGASSMPSTIPLTENELWILKKWGKKTVHRNGGPTKLKSGGGSNRTCIPNLSYDPHGELTSGPFRETPPLLYGWASRASALGWATGAPPEGFTPSA